MDRLMISLLVTVFAIFLVDYVQDRIYYIKRWWKNKQYENKRNKIK